MLNEIRFSTKAIVASFVRLLFEMHQSHERNQLCRLLQFTQTRRIMLITVQSWHMTR